MFDTLIRRKTCLKVNLLIKTYGISSREKQEWLHVIENNSRWNQECITTNWIIKATRIEGSSQIIDHYGVDWGSTWGKSYCKKIGNTVYKKRKNVANILPETLIFNIETDICNSLSRQNKWAITQHSQSRMCRNA